MRIIYCVLCCFASIYSIAQPTLGIAEPGAMGGNYGSVNYLDVSTVGQKKVENISYEDVRGSAFWDDKWNAAIFVLSNNKTAKVRKARLNLYTNEVHFMDLNGTELALENTKALKVIFFKGMDTTTVLAVFESLPDSLSPTKNSYYQVLNNGKFRLLVLQKNSVRESEYDPTIGKREHSFYSKTTYAIANDQNIIPIKSLNQPNIFAAISASPETEAWVSQNKYKLKTETQVVAFLNLYNGQNKSQKEK
jgi:hypothetical protein